MCARSKKLLSRGARCANLNMLITIKILDAFYLIKKKEYKLQLINVERTALYQSILDQRVSMWARAAGSCSKLAGVKSVNNLIVTKLSIEKKPTIQLRNENKYHLLFHKKIIIIIFWKFQKERKKPVGSCLISSVLTYDFHSNALLYVHNKLFCFIFVLRPNM